MSFKTWDNAYLQQQLCNLNQEIPNLLDKIVMQGTEKRHCRFSITWYTLHLDQVHNLEEKPH